MEAHPIDARCRHCTSDFPISDLLLAVDGRCPICGWTLTPEWTIVLQEESRNADAAMMLLVRALRRLYGLPGNLQLLPHSVFRNLFEEVGWEQDLSVDPDYAGQELRLLRLQFESWERLAQQGKRDGTLERLKRALTRSRRSDRSTATLETTAAT
jgi:hypothetical protein